MALIICLTGVGASFALPRLEFLLLWLGGFYDLVVHLVGNVRLLLKSGV